MKFHQRSKADARTELRGSWSRKNHRRDLIAYQDEREFLKIKKRPDLAVENQKPPVDDGGF